MRTPKSLAVLTVTPRTMLRSTMPPMTYTLCRSSSYICFVVDLVCVGLVWAAVGGMLFGLLVYVGWVNPC